MRARASAAWSAVDDLSFQVKRGEIVGLIGPNGSGKTTVLNLISGALTPDAGEIRFKGGRDRRHESVQDRPARRRAHLPARARAADHERDARTSPRRSSHRAHPLWGADAARARRRLLTRVGLAASAPACTPTSSPISTRSGSNWRARSRSSRELLLLDEWLAGLNPTELGEGIALIRSLQDSGLTIVLVEHVMDAIRSLCGRCIVMNAGKKIADGPPAAALADPEVVRAYLGEVDA